VTEVTPAGTMKVCGAQPACTLNSMVSASAADGAARAATTAAIAARTGTLALALYAGPLGMPSGYTTPAVAFQECGAPAAVFGLGVG
jgi:hypothetical protein